MSSTRHAVIFGPSFTGLGYSPLFTPAHHVDLLTGKTLEVTSHAQAFSLRSLWAYLRMKPLCLWKYSNQRFQLFLYQAYTIPSLHQVPGTQMLQKPWVTPQQLWSIRPMRIWVMGIFRSLKRWGDRCLTIPIQYRAEDILIPKFL